MTDAHYTTLITRAEELVRMRILGNRKGLSEVPNYIHSIRVARMLETYGFSKETQIAGLLHDIVEDSDVSFALLEAEGFPKEVLDIVRLCTHDEAIPHPDYRWILMIIQLAKADCMEAWAVKLADVFDNFSDAHALTPDRRAFMRDVKIPVLLSASQHLLMHTSLWKDLQNVLLARS